jgi:hypothetical protein
MRAVDCGRRVDLAMMTEVRALLPATPKHVFICGWAARSHGCSGTALGGGKFHNYSEGNHMSDSRIKEHMEVIGADGVHIGTVDRVENGKIKLIKADSGMGSHKGHHHYIDLSLVADVEGQKVRLSANGAVAVTMEEEAPKPG